MEISARFHFKEQHQRDSQDAGRMKIPMHLTKPRAIWFLWAWGLIYENEANTEDFRGKNCYFWKTIYNKGCPFISCFLLLLMQPPSWQNRSKETSENKLIKLLCQLGAPTPTAWLCLKLGKAWNVSSNSTLPKERCWVHHLLLATLKDDTFLTAAPIYMLFSMLFFFLLLSSSASHCGSLSIDQITFLNSQPML